VILHQAKLTEVRFCYNPLLCSCYFTSKTFAFIPVWAVKALDTQEDMEFTMKVWFVLIPIYFYFFYLN